MHHQMMGYPMHQLNPYGMPMSHVHHHGAHFLDDQRLGTLSEPGAHFADLSDLQSEIGKPMNKGLKGLSASVPDLTGKLFEADLGHLRPIKVILFVQIAGNITNCNNTSLWVNLKGGFFVQF